MSSSLKDANAKLDDFVSKSKGFTLPTTDLAGAYAIKDIQQMSAQRVKDQRDAAASIAKSEKALTSILKTEYNRQSDEAIKALQRRQNSAKEFQDAFGGRLIGASTVGGFLGGLTAGAVLASVDAVRDLTKEAVNLGIESVKLGANLQDTVNSLSVVTGSARSAREEIAGLAKLAASTPGLRYNDAKAGAVELRNLGFDRRTTEDLTVGISKLKLASPNADEGAVQRVLVNLTQLKAGSPQIQKDIQQMILAFPKLSEVIDGTFGSLDKFKAALNQNPDTAIKKLAEGMKNMEAPAAGLNDALGKLQDQVIQTGEIFAEPILDPLTDSVKRLTAFIDENKSTVREWGQYVGNVIAGVSDAQNDPRFRNVPAGTTGVLARAGAFFATYGVSEFARAAYQNTVGEAETRGGIINTPGIVQRALKDVTEGTGEGERRAQARRAMLDKLKEEERARQQELDLLDSKYKERFSIIDNNLKVEELLYTKHNNTTLGQERGQIEKVSALRAAYIRERAAAENQYYNDKIRLADTQGEQVKLDAERNSKLRDLNSELIKNEIETQLRLEELAERRKQALQTFSSIRADAVSTVTGNPAAKMLDDLAKSANDAYESTKALGEATANAAANYVRMAGAVKLSNEALQANLRAIDYRQQAQLAALTPSYELNGMPRRLETLERSVGVLSGISAANAQARIARDLYDNPNYAKNPNYERNQIFDQIDGAERLASRAESLARQFGNLGVSGQGIIARAVLGAMPDVNSLVGLAQQGSGTARNALGSIANLNSTIAAAQEEELKRILAKNQVIQNTALPFALEKVNALQAARGADRSGILDQLIAITGELGSENTAETLRARINALNEKAKLDDDFRKAITDTLAAWAKNGVPVVGAELTNEINVYGDATTETRSRPSQNRTRSTR